MRKIILIPFTILALFAVFTTAFLKFFIIPRIYPLTSDMPSKIKKQLKYRQASYTLFSSISPYIQDAVIASQDERFYTNIGIDLKGTFRAIYFSIINGKRQGASTITEQLAKNLYFRDRDTLLTDIETKVLAVYITRDYSKEKILEMYLNDIYYGSHAYGIASASRLYFHTVPAKISLPRAVYLIALIDAPSYLSSHPKGAKNKARIVLYEMGREHYITYVQEQKAADALEKLKID